MPKIGCIHAPLMQKIRFKREQGNHGIKGLGKDLYPRLLPGPNTWCNELNHPALAAPRALRHPFGQAQIESRVVHQQHEVPGLREDCLCLAKVGQDLPAVAQHVQKAHKGKAFQPAKHGFAQGSAEFGATPSIKIPIGLHRAKCAQEFRTQNVAGGFACQNKNAFYSHSQRQ